MDNSLQNKKRIAGVPKIFHTEMLVPHRLQRNWGDTEGFLLPKWNLAIHTAHIENAIITICARQYCLEEQTDSLDKRNFQGGVMQ